MIININCYCHPDNEKAVKELLKINNDLLEKEKIFVKEIITCDSLPKFDETTKPVFYVAQLLNLTKQLNPV